MFPESIDPSVLLGLAHVGESVAFDAWLARLVDAATELVPACGLASVTSARDGAYLTLAASTDTARALDQAQYDDGAGPCVTACDAASAARFERSAADGDTEFARSADEHGVVAVFSVPLTGAAEPRSLNCYSVTAPLGGVDETAAWVLAAIADAAQRTWSEIERAQDLARSVEAALIRRDVIGQAKGILMAQRGVNADQAFELLRTTSQTRNVKLVEVAGIVARTGRLDG